MLLPEINAANFARTRGIPYFGICLGMQIATIEFARNVANLNDANSTEFDQASPYPVICLLEEQKSITHKGASMRLGTWVCDLKPKTKSFDLYNSSTINERHRHRFEFNSDYREELEAAGLIVAGTSPDGSLVEIILSTSEPSSTLNFYQNLIILTLYLRGLLQRRWHGESALLSMLRKTLPRNKVLFFRPQKTRHDRR